MSKLKCDIVTPTALLCSNEPYMVIVPGAEGEMGFLEGHEPLVSVLADGVVRLHLEDGGEVLKYVLQGGYVEVTGEKVIILADRACPLEEVDVAQAREDLSTAEARFSELSEEEAKSSTLDSDIAWYKAQITASEKN
ncbi:MAG: ATP synthase F1 subunit epsilon [Raoultibacter sp.]|jgi:F-type H+-transporting ATPase subunit epsilon